MLTNSFERPCAYHWEERKKTWKKHIKYNKTETPFFFTPLCHFQSFLTFCTHFLSALNSPFSPVNSHILAWSITPLGKLCLLPPDYTKLSIACFHRAVIISFRTLIWVCNWIFLDVIIWLSPSLVCNKGPCLFILLHLIHIISTLPGT